MAGIPEGVARTIAGANDFVDKSLKTTSFPASERQRKAWHFVSTDRFSEAIDICRTTWDPKEFGRYLHVIQDYYAHFIPTLRGEYGHWGKPEYAGIDDPYSEYHDWNKIMEMAQLTYDLMKAFQQKMLEAAMAMVALATTGNFIPFLALGH